MKVNPSTLRIQSQPEFVAVIKSPNLDEEIKLRLKNVSAVALAACREQAEILNARHVTGIGDPSDETFIHPIPLAPVGGQPCVASVNTFTIAAVLESAQVVERDEDRYTTLDLIAFMQDNGIFNQLAVAFENATKTRAKSDPNTETSSDA